VALGVFLLAGSVFLAGQKLHSFSPAAGGSGSGGGGGGQAAGDGAGSAIAYVDVEGGVSHLYPVVHGRVTDLPVKEGTEVKKGTVLLRVDDTVAKIRLAEASIAVEAALKQVEQAQDLVVQRDRQIDAQKAAVQAAESHVGLAKAKYAQVKFLHDKKVRGNPEDLKVVEKLVKEAEAGVAAEKAKLALVESTRPQRAVELAKLDVLAKQEQVGKAAYALKQCEIEAPSGGRLLRKLVSVGDVLGPNPQGPALIFQPAGQLIIRAEVEQEFAGAFNHSMKAGDEVQIFDEVRGGPVIKGKIQRISSWIAQRRSVLPEPRQFNDIRTLEVIVMPEKQDGLRIGQRVRVELGRRPGR
jgi:multidrug resistance efflux pump